MMEMVSRTAAYDAFLRAKAALAPTLGFAVQDEDIHPLLKPHQRECVRWGVRGGRRAFFLAFGLGKTVIQLETVRLTRAQAGGMALIVLPLGVRQEFARDAAMIDLPVRFIRRLEEAEDPEGIYLTNYETVRDGKLDPRAFTVISLDEAACLRSYGSKTFQTFLELCAGVPYRFVATATPSPNRFKELIHYAGFLGVMDTGQALTRFFQRNPQKAGDLTLYPHKEQEFWVWLNSWAVFLQKPSDLGHDDSGYALPELHVLWHEVPSDLRSTAVERDGQQRLFQDSSLGVSDQAREKRQSLPARLERLTELLADAPDEHCLIWHDLEDERKAIEKAIPGVVSVFGQQSDEAKEQAIIGFSDGAFPYLAAKPVMLGAGCNFQRHCHRAVFLGVGFKFYEFIQALHRIYRFLQGEEVTVHIIYSEGERSVVQVLREKWQEHRELVARMSEIIRERGLSRLANEVALTRSLGVERQEASGEGWLLAHNDCVLETMGMESDSVDLIVTSVPFSNHYEYTPSYNDFGHTDDDQHFFAQMDFLTPELLRVLKPGRVACIHVKDRVLFGNVTGCGRPTINPFHAKCIDHYQRHGFAYCGMITVVTDVVRENNQTYRLGWSEQCKDGTKMGVGSPEYVLLLCKLPTDRSRGYADEPVVKDKQDYPRSRWQVDAHAFWRSNGDRLPTAEDLALLGPDGLAKFYTEYSLSKPYDHEEHVRIGAELEKLKALPATFLCLAPGSHDPDVWHDVQRMRTLNGAQASLGREMHICLARGSLVLTRGGYKPIQEVAVGEDVLTHRGRWRPVLAVQNTGVRPAVTLKAQGVPGLTLTPDHKLWTRAVRDITWARAHSKKEAAATEPGWVPAAETVGSYINLKLPEPEAPSTEDEGLWWIVGRWLADGHIDQRGTAVISCGRHKLDDLLQRLGERACNPRDTGTSLQIPLRDPGRAVRSILDTCGRGAANKHLPPEGYTLPVGPARALLNGYLSGDGHFQADRNRWDATSVSKELLLGIGMLAQRVYGAVASLYAGRPAGETIVEGRTVKTQQDWVLSFDLPSTRHKGDPFLLPDGAWKKVRSVEDAGEVETWNLRVEEDESFTAEGCIVKNCPLQYDIVDRLIRRYTNPGELVYDPFGGLGTVPLRALLLGRRGRSAELNAQYWQDSVWFLERAAFAQQQPSLLGLLGAVG